MSDPHSDPITDHYDDVYRFVRRRTATSEDAEDVTQTVFAEAAHRLQTSALDQSRALGWLYTVARRRLIDEMRRRTRRDEGQPLVDDLEAPPVQYGSDVSEALSGGLAALPAPQRAVVVGRLIEGRSFGEIAATLGSSEGACKMRFARALDTLRQHLEKEGVTP